ncbi:MAG: ABC transporter permease [Oscillospiraceae bacterium]|nr:ABC transporter permease [Oscillospiraceae bacterium]
MKKKLTVNSLAVGNLKLRRKQYTILIIGIILAMVFSSGTLFFISCMQSSREETMYRRQGKQDYIILNAQDIDFSPAVTHGDIDGEIGYAHVLSYAISKTNTNFDGITIGWLDERGKELYYQQLEEGRFPEKAGEIAIEKTMLSRMKIDAEIGDEITLLTYASNGSVFLPEETQQTYTLVGVLADRRIYLDMLHPESYEISQFVPCAFVAPGEQVAPGGKENLIALFNENWQEYSLLYDILSEVPRLSTDYIYSISIGDTYSNISNSTTAFAFLSVLLTFASAVTIVNSFGNNLKERKNQIGMLRAVGATKRQIINIFGREAFIISIISAPISTALAYFGVRLFSVLMGDYFVFIPNVTVLILGAVIGIICVMLAALIPLFGIAKLSPMQAIRDIELMRKMKNKKIKSQKNFSVSRLLAKRNLTFSPGRRIVVSVLLCITTLVGCFSVSYLYIMDEENYFTRYDYTIHNYGEYGRNSFINSPSFDKALTENSRQECLSLPTVQSVLGVKSGYINIIIEGEYPEYLKINEYDGIGSTARYMPKYEMFSGLPDLREDNLDEYMSAEINPDYVYVKQVAGYTEEIFNSSFTARSGELLRLYEDDLLYGEINIEKLNSGEEIIINAPDKIGFSYELTSNGESSISSLVNLSSDDPAALYDKRTINHVIKSAESPFKVGDTLTLSFLYDDGTGKVTRTDRAVKIGAITGKNYYGGRFSIVTTLEGLQKFGGNLPYDELGVMIKDGVTAESDEEMQTELEAMFPDKDVTSKFAFNEGEKQEIRLTMLAVISLIIIFSCICISLINNSISSQIRYSKKTIGTLRAVGASEKDLSFGYFLQVLSMVAWGFGAGIVSYIISRYLLGFFTIENTLLPFTLWPVLLLMAALLPVCFINIKTKVRQVMKHSIVENIREL